MATFVQVSEEDPAYTLVYLIHALVGGKDINEKVVPEGEEAEEEEEDDMEEIKSSKLGKLVSDGQYVELLEQFFTVLDKLYSADEAAVDGGFSLAFAVLECVDESKKPQAVETLSASLTKQSNPHPLTRLHLLTILFNCSPTACKYNLILSVLQMCLEQEREDLLSSQLDHMRAWAEEWALEPAQSAELYLRASKIVADVDKSQKLKMEYLSCVESTKERKSKTALSVAASVCATSLVQFQDAPHLNPARIADIACVKDLAGTEDAPMLALVEIFAAQKVAEFKAFRAKHEAYCKGQGLDLDALLPKIRTLTVCSLGVEHEAIPYAALREALDLSAEEEVEGAVIEAVLSGRFEAKIDQARELVIVLRSTQRRFTDKDWATLGDKLDQWKENVGKVLANLHNIQLPEPEEYHTEQNDH